MRNPRAGSSLDDACGVAAVADDWARFPQSIDNSKSSLVLRESRGDALSNKRSGQRSCTLHPDLIYPLAYAWTVEKASEGDKAASAAFACSPLEPSVMARRSLLGRWGGKTLR
mmetsp:Transcript_17712/g.40674  ORF Transcript_17712/g.40674 Transcript_17712/m.40674 type:complete len:113 (-) Transcript_17712:84-422(-)